MSDSVTIASERLSASVAALGAETQSLTLKGRGELLWGGDPAWWSGRAPILFPMVGGAPGDTVAFDGATYPMAKHGFARRSTFVLEEAGPDWCRHVLTDSDETRAAYPFAFRLAVTHALEGATLTVTAEVENPGDRPLPFGFGFHPAFRWPLPGAEGQPHRVVLENGAEPPLARLGAGGLLAPGRLPSPFSAGVLTLDPALFEADAMIFPEGAGTALRLEADGQGVPALRFAFENTPHLGIWQKPGAPYICIEPWHGMAAEEGAGPEMTARPGTVTLAPGDSIRFGFSVSAS